MKNINSAPEGKMNLLANLALTTLAPTFWGSTYIVTTQMLPADKPLLAAVLRALPAGLLLLAFCKVTPKGSWWGKLAILGFLNIGFFFYCLFSAAYYLPGGLAALVMSCGPLLVMGLSVVLLKQSITASQIGAAALGIVGMALLVLNFNAELNWHGVFFGLAGACSMALGVVLTKRWGRPEGFTLLGFTGWQLFFGGLIILPIALWQERLPSTLTPINIAGYLYLCLVGSVFAYSIWFRGIERLPTVTVSFLGFFSPISASVLGYIVLHQTFTPLQLLGVLAIIGAIYLSKSRSKKYSALAAKPIKPEVVPENS